MIRLNWLFFFYAFPLLISLSPVYSREAVRLCSTSSALLLVQLLPLSSAVPVPVRRPALHCGQRPGPSRTCAAETPVQSGGTRWSRLGMRMASWKVESLRSTETLNCPGLEGSCSSQGLQDLSSWSVLYMCKITLSSGICGRVSWSLEGSTEVSNWATPANKFTYLIFCFFKISLCRMETRCTEEGEGGGKCG